MLVRHLKLRLALLWLIVSAFHLPLLASPKREMRGVWVATVWGIDWPSCTGTDSRTADAQQAELISLLDRVKSLNFTTVCFQVRSMGDAMYRSSLEPWSGFLTGRRGCEPQWDPLGFVVEQCHARGLECYAWVNPFRWSTGPDYSTPQDRKWKDNGWLMTHGKYTVFNPGLEDARQHIVAVCRDILERYEVDGMLFDDYFYPQKIAEDSTAPDYDIYLEQGASMTLGDWRRANIHKTVADVASMIRDNFPGCRFGISPAGVAGKSSSSAAIWGTDPCDVKADDWQYHEIYSDPVGWMYEGTVDFISPQIYWTATHPTAPSRPLVRWWSGTSNLYGTHLYSSLTLENLSRGNRRENIADVGNRIDMNRAESLDGNQGVIVYSSRFLPVVEQVLSSRFERPSLTPEICNFDNSPIAVVRNLRRHGDKLIWDECADIESGRGMRYSVYAVPPGVSDDDAMASDGDGIDGRYLLGITYHPYYPIDHKRTGWRYAVCVYTPFSAEGTPAWHK